MLGSTGRRSSCRCPSRDSLGDTHVAPVGVLLCFAWGKHTAVATASLPKPCAVSVYFAPASWAIRVPIFPGVSARLSGMKWPRFPSLLPYRDICVLQEN